MSLWITIPLAVLWAVVWFAVGEIVKDNRRRGAPTGALRLAWWVMTTATMVGFAIQIAEGCG